jgi:hypothetical protein
MKPRRLKPRVIIGALSCSARPSHLHSATVFTLGSRAPPARRAQLFVAGSCWLMAGPLSPCGRRKLRGWLLSRPSPFAHPYYCPAPRTVTRCGSPGLNGTPYLRARREGRPWVDGSALAPGPALLQPQRDRSMLSSRSYCLAISRSCRRISASFMVSARCRTRFARSRYCSAVRYCGSGSSANASLPLSLNGDRGEGLHHKPPRNSPSALSSRPFREHVGRHTWRSHPEPAGRLLFLVVHALISEPVVLLRDVEQIAARQGRPDPRRFGGGSV